MVSPSPDQTTAPAIADLRRLAGPLFSAMERSGLAMVVTDPRLPDNPIIFVNDAFSVLTGYPRHEVIGRNCRFLQGDGTDQATVARIKAALNEGRPVEGDVLNYHKDGTSFWNRLFITPVLDGSDQLSFFLSTQHDASATYNAEAARNELNARQLALDDVTTRLRVALSIAGTSASWVWHIAEGRITGDEGFASLYGIMPGEAKAGIGRARFFSIIHPDDQTRIRLAVGGMLRGAELFSKEFRILLADGSMRWMQARGRCHFDENEAPVRFSGVMVDVTEQKRVEEKLRVAQTSGGIGTFEYVLGFGTVSVAEQFCQLMGLQPTNELPTRTVNTVIYPGDPPFFDTATRGEVGTVSRVDFRIIRPDTGEPRWLTRRGEYLRDVETTGVRFSGVVYDITEAKQTEEALRTLNETLETRVAERTRERDRVWQASRDLYVLCDLAGRCTGANPAWKAQLGFLSTEIEGRRLGDLVAPDDRRKVEEAIVRLARNERVESFDVTMLAKSGAARTFSWTCVPEGNSFFAAGRDVTERNELEAQLRQSQKMEAVGQLTGGIAHDFNNMLTGITGSLDMIRRRIDQGRADNVGRFLDVALASAERAAALTHRLLVFSRRQALNSGPLDVNQLVASLEDLLRRSVGEQVEFAFELHAGLWTAFSDANQVENALLNLVINSRDAMPGGGKLTVQTSNAPLTEADVKTREGLVAGDYVAISVADTGSGMSPEVVAKAFDPFFTTKPVGQGTGLGLSMIYGFVRQAGGHVNIESELGKGTRITLYIPRFTGVRPAIAEGITAQPLPLAQGETVLVVEDDPAVRLLVQEVLSELGYGVIEAVDSRTALPVLTSSRQIELMISDIGLPGMSGRQLAEIARGHRPDLKILFITGYAENAAVRADLSVLGTDVISKPFSIESLTFKIRDILG